MLMPSIFGENLFDDFFNDFPFYDDKAGQKIEKKLYGRHGQNLMKTDIKEMEDGYELEMDLPGFKKEEISISLEFRLRRDWMRTRRRKSPVVTSAESVTQVPVREASMSVMI